MKNKSLVSALTKAGLKIETQGNNLQVVNGPKYQLSWYIQDQDATCVHLRRHGDESDLMTDYHAGFFVNTIKWAVSTVQES